jgi:predicted ATP-grasp superfamily ATP-dependent carboligase
MKLTDKRFRYHSAASHNTSDGLKSRMRRYAEQVKKQEARATVTPIKRKARS